MSRYFLEVSYKGTHYSGFQVQPNARTIQDEIQKALLVFYKKGIELTGSSRTDAGVHALQNFFHFDADIVITDKQVYNLNAILPNDIVIKSIKQVADNAHCRFDASSREYAYYIYQEKDPFLEDRAWFFPYTLNIEALNEAASILLTYKDFTSFSKKNSQVKTFLCDIQMSRWEQINNTIVYKVKANRFLRGMVRGLVGTMLRVGRGQMSIDEFKQVVEAKDCTKADFTTPAHGLFLVEVAYPNN